MTPLLIAIKEGHTEVVRELLQYNTQLEATGLLMVEKEYRRVNIFDCAVITRHFEIARMLVHAGYDLTLEKYLWANDDVPKQLILNLDFWCWLREMVSQPKTLLQVTKKKIKHCLGSNVKRKLNDLDLPVILKKYIFEVDP